MKGLPPSLRSRKRYIAFRIIAEKKIDERSLSRALSEKMLSLFGECFAASGFRLEEFDGERGIVRCYREALDKVMVALTLMTHVGGVRVIPLTLGVSGTIKRCKRKYLGV
ncbi:Rpp14/Pop5 family protein [Archaeoglobus sp.]|uniref:Rpp14/Pop5 family protein n=1 Tax=Archaeoglobus sp. TaxID=1872626 RepID=UPI0024AB8E88|nr:Rpp14/Pop5 family protein [Archaeoglobus sp.]MDI3498763.1 ribonuclease protein subunit [Archaeoglobus sp.]